MFNTLGMRIQPQMLSLFTKLLVMAVLLTQQLKLKATAAPRFLVVFIQAQIMLMVWDFIPKMF